MEYKTKIDLLKELEELGQHPSGRKVRSDKNTTGIRKLTKTRRDKGTRRESYSKDTAGYAKRQFNAFIRSHKDPNGEGDTLTRDVNMIFPPNTTHYYKPITVKATTILDKRTNTTQQREGYTYQSSRRRPNHPEKLRWTWFFRELREATTDEQKQYWTNKICQWYFIRPDQLHDWTYTEWAWEYVHVIGGHPNRHPDNIILNYDDYLLGLHGIPTFDLNDNIVWPK